MVGAQRGKEAPRRAVMSDSDLEATDGTPKGAIMRLFGVVLIFLATLDAMLSWRGGITPSNFYIWLFAAGIAFYAVGAVRREREG